VGLGVGVGVWFRIMVGGVGLGVWEEMHAGRSAARLTWRLLTVVSMPITVWEQ